MNLVDTHCHLDLEQFSGDFSEMLDRAVSADVTRMILPAINMENNPVVLGLANQYDSLYCGVGVHPNYTAEWQTSHLDQIKKWALSSPKVVAIGEIGVDYYWDYSPPAMQHQAFTEQMILADELDLPIIIHNREASEDIVRLLSESPLVGKDGAGVMHSFFAEYEVAKQVLDMGFYLGFTGPLTFKKSKALREIASKIPLDRILLETDAPYLTPSPHRGKRNEPSYVRFVAEKMAEIHNIPLEEITEITTANAEKLFRL